MRFPSFLIEQNGSLMFEYLEMERWHKQLFLLFIGLMLSLYCFFIGLIESPSKSTKHSHGQIIDGLNHKQRLKARSKILPTKSESGDAGVRQEDPRVKYIRETHTPNFRKSRNNVIHIGLAHAQGQHFLSNVTENGFTQTSVT